MYAEIKARPAPGRPILRHPRRFDWQVCRQRTAGKPIGKNSEKSRTRNAGQELTAHFCSPLASSVETTPCAPPSGGGGLPLGEGGLSPWATKASYTRHGNREKRF